ncbi:hypothetical protein SDB63_08460, partial [Brucella sp. NBRC 113783]|uniref:hypothetical protein n=1 Tax=Brucella sp. NBRC 113783 TaxID=3075478 RepID=UPI0029C0AC7D
ILEHRSGAYLKVREHRSTENCSLQTGITKNTAVVLIAVHYDRSNFGQSLSKCLINWHENKKSGPKAAFPATLLCVCKF